MLRLLAISLLAATIPGPANGDEVPPELRARGESFLAMMSGELEPKDFIAEQMSSEYLAKTPASRPLMIFSVLKQFYQDQPAELQSMRETPEALILVLSNFENRWAEYELLVQPGNPSYLLAGLNARILGVPPEDDWKELSPQALIERLQKYLGELEKAGKFSGSVILARGDRVLLDFSAGKSDPAKSIPVTSETSFPVASVSKSFTAAAVWALVDRGQIDLDAVIASYLPELKGEDLGNATVRELLEHRSGLQSFTLLDETTESLPSTSLEDLAKAYSQLALGKKGETVYSNAGAAILGWMIESITGSDIDSWLRQAVFEPAGMKHSGFLPKGPAVGSVSWGTFEEPQSGNRTTSAIWFEGCVDPAKSAIASASDLHRFSQALFAGKISGDKTVRDAIERSGLPQTSYANGLRIERVNGVVALGHSGALPGVSAQWWYFPESQYGIFITSDRSESGALIAERLRTGISFGKK